MVQTLWADDLLHEYETGRKAVTSYAKQLDRTDPNNDNFLTLANSMIAGSKETEEWLSTGRDPRTYKGIDKRSIYHKNAWDAMELIPDIRDQLEGDGPPELSLSVDSKEKLSRIFSALSPRERQCYILHNAQRLSMAEIAVELGVSKSAVQIYIKRAKEKVEVRT